MPLPENLNFFERAALCVINGQNCDVEFSPNEPEIVAALRDRKPGE